MKLLCSILVLFSFALCASAQALSNPVAGSRVTVIQKKWRIEVHNPAVEKDPFKSNKEREQEERDLKALARENQRRTESGDTALPPLVRMPVPEDVGRELSLTYIYEVKVSNTGEKAIRTLTWEYVFFEPGTEREVGRRRFVSKVNISAGKSRNVVMRSASPPTGTIDATKAGKKSRDLYSEQVVIQSVEYADGSVWQAASN